MKFPRLAALLVCASVSCFGASKEMVELQRDVALLQEQATAIQRTLDEKLASLQVLVQQSQENSSRTANQVQGLQSDLSTRLGEQLRPMMNMGQKVDNMQQEVQGLRDSMADLSSRLDRLDAKMTDISNKITMVTQPAPPPPGSGPTANGGPPAGMSAEQTFANAQRDQQAGNFDIALKQYGDYLTYFGQTDQAPTAQFNVGQIYYNRGDMDKAAQAFDTVLTKYPENSQTPNAYYMKGMSLYKLGQRDDAANAFRELIDKYPHTDQANKARAALRSMGVAAPAAPTTTKGKRKPSA
jgi:tol-pal system protein YbgF